MLTTSVCLCPNQHARVWQRTELLCLAKVGIRIAQSYLLSTYDMHAFALPFPPLQVLSISECCVAYLLLQIASRSLPQPRNVPKPCARLYLKPNRCGPGNCNGGAGNAPSLPYIPTHTRRLYRAGAEAQHLRYLFEELITQHQPYCVNHAIERWDIAFWTPWRHHCIASVVVSSWVSTDPIAARACAGLPI